jgi:acyl-CoA reductase-like NAD-dependent aldehyde dehydrogenase
LAASAALLHDNIGIVQAISSDFGHRSVQETKLLEIAGSLKSIRYARRHIKRWMSPGRRMASGWFLPARVQIVPQALGVVGIIVPWNYPIALAVVRSQQPWPLVTGPW